MSVKCLMRPGESWEAVAVIKRAQVGPFTTHLSATGNCLLGRCLHRRKFSAPRNEHAMNATRPRRTPNIAEDIGAQRAIPRPMRAVPRALTGAVLGVLGSSSSAGLIGATLAPWRWFTPLFTVHSTAYGAPVQTEGTGMIEPVPALIPVAVLAAVLTIVAVRSRSRARGAGVLGLVALGIALLGDLPDARGDRLRRQPADVDAGQLIYSALPRDAGRDRPADHRRRRPALCPPTLRPRPPRRPATGPTSKPSGRPSRLARRCGPSYGVPWPLPDVLYKLPLHPLQDRLLQIER